MSGAMKIQAPRFDLPSSYPKLVAPADFIRKSCVSPAKVALWGRGGTVDKSRVVALAVGVACMLFAILTIALIVTAVFWAAGIL
jgi:hypothetical protein